MPTLKTITLGCKVNQYETEYVRQGFERLGYRAAAEGEAVDLCIVNSCTVTAESEAKSRKTIRRIAHSHPEARIIVIGCYVARAAKEVAALPGVVEVVADKRQLPELLARHGLGDVPTGIGHFSNRRRALVKVQDGCRMRCSYCIVPTVRPHSTSRPAAEVVDEVDRLVASGHREIVLTGIHLGDYGWSDADAADGQRTSGGLAHLVRRITDMDGEFRVRLSSIEAAEVTPELLEVMAERPERVCPHLHIPLQSGSDTVLERMNRRWPVQRFIERCGEIWRTLDRPALTTDVIVGFPGETEADFAATCEVVEAVGFARVHVFRFSPRRGTPAATMPGQVINRVVQQRAGELGKLGEMLSDRYLRSLVGRPMQVIIEGPARQAGWMLGTCARHTTTIVPGGRELIGRLVYATAERIEEGRIVAG